MKAGTMQNTPIGERVQEALFFGEVRESIYPQHLVARGMALRELRKSFGLTLRQAASALGWTGAKLSAVELGSESFTDHDAGMAEAAELFGEYAKFLEHKSYF